MWWDQYSHRLPDRFTLPALFLSALWVGGVAAVVDIAVVQTAALGYALSVLGLWLLAEAPGRPLGFGDVKLGALLGMHLGAHHLDLIGVWLVTAFLSGGAHAVVGVVSKRMSARDHLAFGPHLVIGWLVALALGAPPASAPGT